jgi:hypothetical protein
MADAIGITPQRLSRAMAEGDDFAFNVENCLRLAMVVNRSPGEVLRAADKGEVADLLEHLFPHAGRPVISGEQKQLLDDWARLDQEERDLYRRMLHLQATKNKRRQSTLPYAETSKETQRSAAAVEKDPPTATGTAWRLQRPGGHSGHHQRRSS